MQAVIDDAIFLALSYVKEDGITRYVCKHKMGFLISQESKDAIYMLMKAPSYMDEGFIVKRIKDGKHLDHMKFLEDYVNTPNGENTEFTK